MTGCIVIPGERWCGPGSEEQHVAQVFARCWQTADERQVDVQTLADVLRFVRVHVQAVMLEAMRAPSWPGEMANPQASNGEEPGAAGRHERGEVWDMWRWLGKLDAIRTKVHSSHEHHKVNAR